MIQKDDLITIARERLADAEALLQAQRYDSAVYICGYSIEIALKYRICQTLNWTEFPSNNSEFAKYKSLKTHDLSVLLHFTGFETLFLTTYLPEWLAIVSWNPEARYTRAGLFNEVTATYIISSVQTLIDVI